MQQEQINELQKKVEEYIDKNGGNGFGGILQESRLYKFWGFLKPHLLTSSDKEPGLSKEEVERTLKTFATNFFFFWYNKPGANTCQGYDSWMETEEGKYWRNEIIAGYTAATQPKKEEEPDYKTLFELSEGMTKGNQKMYNENLSYWKSLYEKEKKLREAEFKKQESGIELIKIFMQLLPELIEMGGDAMTLYKKNAVHQEFQEESRDTIKKARKLLQDIEQWQSLKSIPIEEEGKESNS